MSQAVNNFIITGRITKKPEIRETSHGNKYTFVGIAVNGINKEKPDFLSFVLWDKLADNIVKYCDKGDLISVNGHISSFQKDGITAVQLTGDAVTFLSKSSKKEEPRQETKSELPFENNFQPANSGDIFAPF